MCYRSQTPYGVANECRRGLVHGMGYTEEEFKRPIIAVVNSWNEYNPGHIHLRAVAERVKQGVREAGGLPFELMTTGVCDGMVLKNPRYIELPSRNNIADEVELIVESGMFDGMVLLSTCDSIVPGHLMAAARLDIPAVVMTGGYMPMPFLDGRSANYIELTDNVGKVMNGEYDRKKADREVAAMYSPCGACGVMTTANSMCLAAEALGMSLPGNGCASAAGTELLRIAYLAGRQVMRLLEQGITARKIITREAVENAIAMTMAMGVNPAAVRHTLATFEGVEHRIERVTTVSGVTFFNDSKGTNVDAALRAVWSMEAPTVLIAGGYDKHTDFMPLFEGFTDQIRHVILIGDTAQQLADTAEKAGYTAISRAETFREAVEAAYALGKPGWNVLLSPACASFDMFKDYEERGRIFKEIVRSLKEKEA